MFLKRLRRAGEDLLNRVKVKDLALVCEDIRRWLDTDFGRYLVSCERRILREKCSTLPGYRMLRLGLSEDAETLDCFDHIHRFSMHPSELKAGHAALSDYMDLPLMSETIDVMLLHHALEFSTSPRAVLAEAGRVVMPGGHLIICMFNPYGPMGLLKFPMQLFSKQSQYRFHNLRMGRLIDWLSLLNFHVVQIEHGAYNPPLKSPDWAQRDSLWERAFQKIRFPLGNVYMIHAVKRVPRGTALPLWKRAASNGLRASSGIKRAPHNRNNSHNNKAAIE
ncbi:Methyltransferase domain protein [Gammaproteobacteria bacterium MOLA455]|nr:Methyltransferase domain protein [Gammaproteobacteria bacterium MOLA455]